MKCQRCKEREANVQIMQQIAGKKPQTFLLCDVCARELGISMPTFPMTGKISPNPFSVMGNIFESDFGLGADKTGELPAQRCSQCGMTFEEFKKTGLLGCPQCYEAFSSQTDPVFCRTQMGKKHVGRKLGIKSTKSPDEKLDKPAPEAESEELAALEKQHMDRLIEEKKAELSAALSAEDYLAAAKIRDEIIVLSRKGGEGK